MDKWFILQKLRKGGYFKEVRFPTVMEKIKLISDYTGIKEEELLNIDVDGVNALFNTISSMLISHQYSPPPKELTLDGKEYTFVRNFGRMSAAWHRLVRVSNFRKEPEKMAALCYIEKGMKYAEMGEHKEILNPTRDRTEIFLEHLPLSTFMDINNFFLRKSSAYQKLYPRILKAREMMAMEMMTSQREQAKKARTRMK